MPEFRTTRIRGVQTHPNSFSEVREGSLRVGKNVDIDRESLVTPRPGFPFYGSAFATPGTAANRLMRYQGRLLVHHGTTLEYDDGAGSFTAYATSISPPAAGFQPREAIQNKNLYITSGEGLRKIDLVTDDLYAAGVPRPLDADSQLSGSSGFMADDTAVRYRMVLYITDANDNEVVSAPSESLVVQNSAGGTRDVILTWYLPSGLTTDHYYRVFRSAQTEAAADVPDDELQLIWEKRLSSSNLSSGSIGFTDAQPDNLRGSKLYTNPSEQGIAQANETPPIGKDVVAFKGHLFLFNLIGKHRYFTTFLGTDALLEGDTVTIADQTYTMASAEDTGSREFLLETGGTPSQNIEATCRSLVRNVNADASNSVYAYYVSGFQDVPGKMMFEERSIGGSAFELSGVFFNEESPQNNDIDPFSPPLPSTQNGSQVSKNDVEPGSFAISKQMQPDAFPFANRIFATNSTIRRALALREVIIVLSDTIGIISGTGLDNFRYDELDSTTRLIGPETAVVVNDAVYCMTNQGVVSITAEGVIVRSRDIEVDLQRSSKFADYETTAFGIGYETRRAYFLAQKIVSSDSVALMLWRYNAFTEAWTHYEIRCTAGIVDPVTDRLVLADDVNSILRRERQSYDRTDFADEEYARTISSSMGTLVQLDDDTDLEVGDLLVQSSLESRIVAIPGSDVVQVEDELAWSAAVCTVYRPIDCAIDFNLEASGTPDLVKQHTHYLPIFRDARFKDATLRFASDFVQDYDYSVDVQTADQGGSWVDVPEGSNPSEEQALITYVPQEVQRGHWLRTRMEISPCRESFALAGYGIAVRRMSKSFRGVAR